MAVIRILCWALIFIIKLRFPPGLSLAFNKHFVQIGSNLSQQIPNTKYPPEHYISEFQEQFTFHEMSEQEVTTLTRRIN